MLENSVKEIPGHELFDPPIAWEMWFSRAAFPLKLYV
jgi:hypothetical protein